MTQKEAKAELNRIKESWEDIKDVDLEIERLMTVATKMTPSYEPKTSGGYSNRLEEAVIKIEDYRSRLSNLLVDDLIHTLLESPPLSTTELFSSMMLIALMYKLSPGWIL